MIRLYFRCNGGHYFTSRSSCPFDGWTCNGIGDALSALERATARGERLSIAELKTIGIDEETLQRVLLIEFGDEASAFEALAPGHFVYNGNVVEAHEVGPELF